MTIVIARNNYVPKHFYYVVHHHVTPLKKSPVKVTLVTESRCGTL